VFFNRTIAGKLVSGLMVVLVIVLVQSYGGITGLLSYSETIRQLDFEFNSAPHRAHVAEAVGVLCSPVLQTPRDEEGVEMLRTDLAEAIAKCRSRLTVFQQRLNEMTPVVRASGQGRIIRAKAEVLEQQFSSFQTIANRIRSLDTANRYLPDLKVLALQLQAHALEMPEPVEGLGFLLVRARGEYRRSIVLIIITTVIVLFLLAWLFYGGQKLIVAPVQRLCHGMKRFGRGEYDYRLKLNTHDEMADLAEEFNRMATRVREMHSDLETQVEARSRQLVQSERLAGVGFLAAGVAHEINNPLAALALATEALESRLAPAWRHLDDETADLCRRYLRLVQTEAFRVKDITSRLLDFSRGRDASREAVDVVQLVNEVVAMVQYLTKYREKKIEFTAPASCVAEINAPEIKQVVLNLVANGLESMEKGGTLRIVLEARTDDLSITFHDEGCGMTQEVKDRIFEPFFTQKQNGQGTGLGLSISHRIVTQHGGTITASSVGAGQGSTFIVRLPRENRNRAAA
jgi:signal transduction histidine kinase